MTQAEGLAEADCLVTDIVRHLRERHPETLRRSRHAKTKKDTSANEPKAKCLLSAKKGSFLCIIK